MSRSLFVHAVTAIMLAASCVGVRAAEHRPLTVLAGGSDADAAKPESVVAGDARGGTLEFVRVNAAAADVHELPLDGGRYVPMPLGEFDAAVAALGSGVDRVLQPTASSAEYDLAPAGDGQLAGRLVFEVASVHAGLRTAVPLGAVTADGCRFRTPDGGGPAFAFGMPDGGVAIQTPAAGSYSCGIRIPGTAAEGLVRLPLVPALVTTLWLTLPPGLQPLVVGEFAASALVEPPAADGGRWRIMVAAGREVALVIWDSRRASPPVACWNRVAIRGRQADVMARVVPAAAWMPTVVELRADPGLLITGVHSGDGRDVEWSRAADLLRVRIPDSMVGGREGILVTGIAGVGDEEPADVPALRPPASGWAGCGVKLLTTAAFAVEAIELDQCFVITPAEAAGWPLPVPTPSDRESSGADLPAGCRLFLEHQTPTAKARVMVRPRPPVIDAARVTTVDLSPGTVLGRAACDVRVLAGEVFVVTAAVAPGWFIDSVEAVDWRPSPPRAEPATESGPSLDWRVVRAETGNELRVALPSAATPARSVGLRITGHRPGVPLGERFTAADLDMVRLPGESPESALLEFRVGPMAVIEAESGTLAVEPATGRLQPLAGESSPRGRIRAGERAPALNARLVRRRPPVVSDVRVDLVARDERLAETFGFTCRAVAGEIDAVVVHFSEPMAPGLEWSLAEPATGSLAARRLDPGEAAVGASMPEVGVAESWLVDIRPATSAEVRIQATRTVPLAGPVPVPLAWVEAAERPGGVVSVGGEGGQRPELVNRRLHELPPRVGPSLGDPWWPAGTAGRDGLTDPLASSGEPATVELAYGSPESVMVGGTVAAEVLPAEAAAASRAWAWRESTICRCHDSGMLEWESVFDIENQGRGSLNMTVPEGLLLEQVTVAGAPVTVSEFGPSGGILTVPLPAGRGRLPLVVRGVGRRDARIGWWSLGPIACTVDLPILDRDTRLILPPGLALASGSGRSGQWAGRLFNAERRGQSGPPESPGEQAFDITPSTRGGIATVVVVRRHVVSSLAVLGAAAAAAIAWAAVRWRGVTALVGCGVAAIVALWAGQPWDTIARAVWWGSVVGTWWGVGRRRRIGIGRPGFVRAVAPASVAVLSMTGATAADGPRADPLPLKVIVSPERGGGVALVPEPLFRTLAAAEAAAAVPSVRVLEADVEIGPDESSWRVRLEVDADRGGGLRLVNQDEGGRWLVSEPERSAGDPLRVESSGDGVQVFSAEGGRGTVTLRFEPSFSGDGDVEAAVLDLPPAALGVLATSTPAARTWQCDRGGADRSWVPAAVRADGFDISRTTRVRVVRPVDAADTLVRQPRSAESVNVVSWRSAECRVDASFVIGGESEIVRSLVVRADPRLEPVPGIASLVPLGDGRHQVELPQPRAGVRSVPVAFQMPLADPVGLFEVPWVWLEGVGSDLRTVRLRPEPAFEAVPELPLGTTLMRPKTEDGPATTATWRSEAGFGGRDQPRPVDDGARPRIAVRRRSFPVRGSQALSLDVAQDRFGLRLDVELEAAALPLVEIPLELPPAAIVDRVVLARRSDKTEAGGEADVDVVWTKTAPDRLLGIVQRPEIGLFRLRLEARIPGAPAAAGRLPLARAVLDGMLPLAVTWQAAPGLALTLPDAADGQPQREERPAERPMREWLEVASGDLAPPYALAQDPGSGSAAAGVDGAEPAVAVDVGVALAEIALKIDHRGRGWGIARFDLVAAEPLVQLELPQGMRLFDVRVDGREVTAVPQGGTTWDIRIHDVTWPRTLVAVFAGTVSGPLADGKPILLEPPRIVGLPVASVIWSLDPPPGFLLRVSEPARRLDAGPSATGADRVSAGEAGLAQPDSPSEWTWKSRLHAGDAAGLFHRPLEWYGEAFQAAVAAAEPRERERLEAFARARREGHAPAGEQAWYDVWTSAGGTAEARTIVESRPDAAVTVRPVTVRDPTAFGRGLATLLIAGLALAAWTGGRRVPADGWRALARWWWLACGLAWLVCLTPSLPGWIMLLLGAWLVFAPSAELGSD